MNLYQGKLISLNEFNNLTSEQKQLAVILMIRTGEIQRQHRLFKKDGKKTNEDGLQMRTSMVDQFHHSGAAKPELMNMIHEYTNFGNLLYTPNITARKSGLLVKAGVNLFGINQIVAYLKENWDAWNYNEKALILKFMPRIPTSKRKRKGEKKEKQHFTKTRDTWNFDLIREFCKEFGMTKSEYTKLRSEYMKHTEAVKFSVLPSHKESIKNFNRQEFQEWLQLVPAGARKRVFGRISKKAWILRDGSNALELYNDFFNKKAKAAEELRALQTKQFVQGTISAAEEKKIAELKQEIKTTTNGFDLVAIMESESSDNEKEVMIANLIERVHADINALPIIDISGSMSSGRIGNFKYLEIATMYLTMFMLKNRSPHFMAFSDNCQLFLPGIKIKIPTSTWSNTTKQVSVDSLINTAEGFLTNYTRVYNFVSRLPSGGTNLTCVSDRFLEIKKTNPDYIPNPVIVIFTDSDLNGAIFTSAGQVAKRFLQDIRSLNWNGVVLFWSIYNQNNTLNNIPGFVGFSGKNPAVLQKFLEGSFEPQADTSFAVLDQIWDSEHYAPIKNVVKNLY